MTEHPNLGPVVDTDQQSALNEKIAATVRRLQYDLLSLARDVVQYHGPAGVHLVGLLASDLRNFSNDVSAVAGSSDGPVKR